MTAGGEFPLVDCSVRDDGWTFVVRIPDDSRFFEGHFTNRPVLPAIAQLELITRLVRLTIEEEVALHGIDVLRLVRPVGPGETLSVSLTRLDDDRRQRFTIRGAGDVVSRGTLSWTAGGDR